MSAITTPNALDNYQTTTVDFENLGSLDGEEFGFNAGQPYANLGLFLYSGSVSANANLASVSGRIAARSGTIYTGQNSNSLGWRFSTPQIAVGFFYKDTAAKSFMVRAYDINHNVIEEDTFPAGQGYAGIIRPKADIGEIQTLAPHDTTQIASDSRTFIDDLSFAHRHKAFKYWPHPPSPPVQHGPIVIVIGGIPADGGGIVIGPWGVTPVPPWNPDVR
jgi:hypothetical protein